MDVLLSDEFKSRVEDELAELADKRRNENDKRLKEEHDAQMQKQGAKDAHKEEPDAQTQTPHKPHLVDKACTEEGSKKGQGKGKANTTWQGDTQQGVGPGWVDTSGGDEGWTGWGGTKGGGSHSEEWSKKGQGKGKATTTWQGDTQQGVGPGWVDTSGGDEGWTGWGGTKGGGSHTEEWSKKGQGKGKANTTWQGDTQQGVGPGWVDTSGGDEGWTGWGGTKGGGSRNEEWSKKGQGKGKANTTWQGDTQQGVGPGWVDTSGGDEGWTGWGGTKGGGSRNEEWSKKGQGKGKANTTWQGDTQQGVGPGWVDTSGGDEGWTGWGGTKGGGSRNEEWSKKGQGKGKANTTWQGDTQQGVGPGWVDTSGGDEGWTGWGGTKGGGSKGKGRKETTSPWADDWWQDWGTNQDREYPREAQQGMARSQWGNGNDIMQNRKRMRTWDGHNNGWKGSGKGTNGCDWMPIDPRLIEEGTRAQV